MSRPVIRALKDRFLALPGNDRVKAALLLALLAAHTIFSIFFAAPGHYSVDEAMYHLMARDLVANGSLMLWNGYEEFPSSTLLFGFMQVQPEGTLASQYPHLSTFLVAPFYWALGFRGLFALNALAFAGAAGLCFLIARRLFRDVALALNACLILSLATFAWQYSQAAWPHALSMFIVTLAVYCAVAGYQAQTRRGEIAMALLAGLLLGIGVGVRLDAVFALPAILLPFLFVVPSRPLAALMVCTGLLPGLLALAAINQVKFGIFSPFTYGYAGGASATSGIGRYLPLAITGLTGAVIAWGATRPAGRVILARYRWAAVGGIAVLAAVALLTPQGWAMFARLADGAWQLLVDLRFRDLAIKEGALTRSPDGALIYIGSLKKSLLQSAPYLVALILPVAALLRGRDALALGIALLVPAAYVTVYSYFAWHGGQAVNLRYFVPTLPFFAILTAYAWREIAPALGRIWIGLAAVGGIATAILHLGANYPEPPALPVQETIYLTAPLALAAITTILLLAVTAIPHERAPHIRGAAAAMVLVGLVWGGSVGFAYDFRQVYSIRQGRAALVKDVTPLIRPDSIFFMPPSDSYYGLIDIPRVRLSTPLADNYQSFRPLVDFHLAAGHGVYLWVSGLNIGILQHRGLLVGLQPRPIYRGYGGMLLQLDQAAGSDR
jgi:4-amino-4-deoxy-L-arabinose transferase-like glycosyltransferase